MQAWQSPDLLSNDSQAMDQLCDFLRRRRETCEPIEDFERCEQALHRLFVAAEREALGHELARCDRDVPQVEIEGERYDRVLRCETTYNRAAGPVRVARSLSRHPCGGRTLCPLELRVGMLEGSWTPLAATQATWAVAPVTPQESEELFDLIGTMTPSKSTLDRLPKALSVIGRPIARPLRPPCARKQPFRKRPCRWPSPSMGCWPRCKMANAKPHATRRLPRASRPVGLQGIRKWGGPPCRMMPAWASVF